MGILLSYVRDPQAARAALKTLRRRGVRRQFLLQNTSEGRTTRRDPNLPARLATTLVGGLMASLLGIWLSTVAAVPQILSGHTWTYLAYATMGFGLGAALIGLASFLIIFPGVSRKEIERHAALLRDEESLLILQAPLRSLTGVVHILRD